MMDFGGFANFAIFFLTFASLYAVFALGLNVQWGFTGQFNIGVHGFWAIGSYTAAIATTGPSDAYLGGFGLPFLVGLVLAMAFAGIVALAIGLITVNLRTDYLAIATIGIAEIIRLVLKNEAWLTNTVRGIPGIGRPFDGPDWLGRSGGDLVFLIIVWIVLALVYFAIERALHSPWGRVLRALRESEPATQAAGKDVRRFRLEAFVLGAVIMGLAGALYAHFFRFISPIAFHPLQTTFLVWVMLIAGGMGNNRGAVLGAFAIWLIWTATEFATSQLPSDLAVRAAPLRVLLIGVLLQVILLTRPQGLLPERPPGRSKRRRPAGSNSHDNRSGSS